MVRGVITFYCSECENRFEGIDTEWYCMVFTAPLKCPRCGSWHTRPWSILPAKIANKIYKNIWEFNDRNKSKE